MSYYEKMTAEEICQAYRFSKRPREQVRILAQLNCCGLMDIYRILIDNNEPIRSHKPKAAAVRLLDNETYRIYAERSKRIRMGKA